MISFKLLSEQAREDLLSQISNASPDADIEYASDTLNLLMEQDDDVEYAVSYACGCLLIRNFDGEYSFSYPIPLSDEADSICAAMEIRAYAVKEEIPLVFYDVPSEELGLILPKFRHANIDSEEPLNRYYTVRVMSELALTDEMPSYTGIFGISLTPLAEEDDEDYARLCMDKETNRFWGYDYSSDEPDPEKSYFREEAEKEYCRGTALA